MDSTSILSWVGSAIGWMLIAGAGFFVLLLLLILLDQLLELLKHIWPGLLLFSTAAMLFDANHPGWGWALVAFAIICQLAWWGYQFYCAGKASVMSRLQM